MRKLFSISVILAFLISTFTACNTKSNKPVEDAGDSITVQKSSPGKYCNEKYQFCISYPDTIFAISEENENGAVLTSKDGLSQLLIHRGNFDGSVTGDINSLKQAFDTDLKLRSKQDVTYKAFKSTDYVLMGYEKKIIFYQKTILIKGQIVTAAYTYDDKAKDTYHPLMDGIFKSFE